MPELEQSTQLGAEIKRPIVVPATAAPQMAVTAARYLVVYLIGSLTAKAIVPATITDWLGSDEVVNAIVGVLLTLAMMAWGALKSRKNVAVQQALEAKLPDNIATRA